MSSENGKRYRYVKSYKKVDYEKDEKAFDSAVKSGDPSKVDYSAFKRLMIHDLCGRSRILETKSIGAVRLTDLKRALEAPALHWGKILAASAELMRISPHYYRLNNLFSNMALFCWGVDLYDVKPNADRRMMKNVYQSLAVKLENMNLKHEFGKIMKVLPSMDVFYGLLAESSSDFFIVQVDHHLCKLVQIQDGLYNFKINLGGISEQDLLAYPEYVQDAYLEMREGRGSQQGVWYTPPADKQICIKMNAQWTYPFPLLISLIQDILDLDVYKKLKLQSARTDNYKAILVRVPIDEKYVDKPLLTPETLGVFAEINRESMSDDIGMIHTLGSEGKAISFKDSSNTRNNVSDAVNELYNSSGITHELYNGSSSSTAVTYSIENDAAFVYGVYRQFERWTNRFIKLRKYNKQSFKFFFYLLDATIFNRDTVLKRYRESCTLGIPVVDKMLAALDMTPSRVLGAYETHNCIFDYYNQFKPLVSSFNSSSTESAGRPTNEEKGEPIGDEGEKTSDNDRNDR